MRRPFKKLDWYVTIGVVGVNTAILIFRVVMGRIEGPYYDDGVEMLAMAAISAGYLIFEGIRVASPLLGAAIGFAGVMVIVFLPASLVRGLEGFDQEAFVIILFLVVPSMLLGACFSWFVRWWRANIKTSASGLSQAEIVPNGQGACFIRTEEGPVGIGGWLILPTVGIVLAPFYHMGSIIVRLQSPELYEDAVKLHIVGDVALLVLAVLVGFSLFAGKRRTPTLIITYYLCTTAFFALMACIYGSMGIELKSRVPFMLVALAGQVITCAIWIPYFAKSRRVKATFNDRSISLRQADKLIVHGKDVPLINLKNDDRE